MNNANQHRRLITLLREIFVVELGDRCLSISHLSSIFFAEVESSAQRFWIITSSPKRKTLSHRWLPWADFPVITPILTCVASDWICLYIWHYILRSLFALDPIRRVRTCEFVNRRLNMRMWHNFRSRASRLCHNRMQIRQNIDKFATGVPAMELQGLYWARSHSRQARQICENFCLFFSQNRRRRKWHAALHAMTRKSQIK